MPLQKKKFTVFGFAAIALWSSNIAFARSVSEAIGPVTSATIIYLAGGVLGVGYLSMTGGLKRSLAGVSRKYLIGCGTLFVVYMLSLFLALGWASDRSQVLEVGLVNYLWPMLTLLFSIPLLKLRAKVYVIPGAVIALVGTVLATTQEDPFSLRAFYANLSSNPLPYLLAAIAAVTWALYSVLSRRWKSNSGQSAVPFFMLATGIVLALISLGVDEAQVWSWRVVIELTYMALGPNLAYVLWEQSMQRGDIVLVVSGSYMTPALSTLISALYLGVATGPFLWVGCGLIMVGAAVCRWSVVERKLD